MQAILHDRLPIAKIVNATVVALDAAPQGYQDFDKGAAKKFVLDPHGVVKAAANKTCAEDGGPIDPVRDQWRTNKNRALISR